MPWISFFCVYHAKSKGFREYLNDVKHSAIMTHALEKCDPKARVFSTACYLVVVPLKKHISATRI